jgi:hypothetical protein
MQDGLETTNARLKVYPSKTVLQICTDDIFSVGTSQKRGYDVPPAGEGKDPERSKEVSRSRAVARIRDIAMCNRFSYFFTWTLNGDLIDRYDPDAVYKKVRSFLSGAVQRKGFSYVIVPEYHKRKEGEDKAAIHLHGLCNLGTIQIAPAVYPKGKNKGTQIFDNSGRPVFNMTDWKWGFSTCVPLDQYYERTVNYITKYITKSDDKIFGKWYLSSRNLVKRPEIIPVEHIEYFDYRDSEKLEQHEQNEVELFTGVHLLSEEFPPLGDER